MSRRGTGGGRANRRSVYGPILQRGRHTRWAFARLLLRRWAEQPSLELLLKQCATQALVGNADAHAMNFSFVLSPTGEVSVAPMYDVFSTIAYPHLTTTQACSLVVAETSDW